MTINAICATKWTHNCFDMLKWTYNDKGDKQEVEKLKKCEHIKNDILK
jgi:hypothetical protein